jgi:hypothetical protein
MRSYIIKMQDLTDEVYTIVIKGELVNRYLVFSTYKERFPLSFLSNLLYEQLMDIKYFENML